MTARATPYPPPGFHVRIPEPVWDAALDEVRHYSAVPATGRRRGSEGLVYLGGVPSPDALVVTSLFRLHHEPQGDCVKPTPAEIHWLLLQLRQRDEKLVAQLHTHRHGARHSPGDDEMATSFHDGFLSIVAPGFAANVRRIDQCIVHEYCSGTFRPLAPAATAARFTIHAQLIDRRISTYAGEPNRWDRFARRLKPTAPARH